MDMREVKASSRSEIVMDPMSCASMSAVVIFEVSVSPDSSSVAFRKLAMLPDRFVKLLAMLATLSLRMIDVAEALVSISLRARLDIPGYGKTSLVQTSDSKASIRIRSARVGARIGIRLDVSKDWDLLIEVDVIKGASLEELVFLIMTWHSPDIEPIVVAR